MIVKDLIKKLKKMPQHLDIYMADHDHGHFETNSIVNQVYLIDKKEMDEVENDNFNVDNNTPFKNTPVLYVCIRP